MNIEKKLKRKMVVVLSAFTLLSLLSLILSINNKPEINEKGESFVKRSSYGEGRRQIELEAKTGKNKDIITVPVEEMQYKDKDLEEVFDKAAEALEEAVLGNNESLDKVCSSLNFVSKVPEMPVKVAWLLDENDIIDYTGHVDLSKASIGNNPVMLTAEMTYQNKSAEHSFYINVYKKMPDENERRKNVLERKVMDKEEASRHDKSFVLPMSYNGEKIIWKYPKDMRPAGFMLLGIIMAAGIYAESKQKLKKEEETKKDLMILDYTNIVSQMTLFINAGMTIGNAWRKIVSIYEKKKAYTGVRPAYEEMLYTVHEMDQGVSEKDCYLDFGRRCNIAMYRKFGTMLSSNLRKGNKNISEMLTRESVNAFEERKNLAKKKGEEASTKLLGPMFVMFAVLLAIIVVPAFLSIRI